MFGNLKSSLKTRIKGVVEDIKGRRVDAADPYVAATSAPRPALPAPRSPPVMKVAPVPLDVVEAAPVPVLAPVEAAPVAVVVAVITPVEAAPEPVIAPVEAPVEAAPPVVAPPVVAPPAAPSMASLISAAASGKVASRVLHADMGSTDVASYLARAKANGRSVESVTGGEGVNVAEDGEVYWGPVDNDSSRAKAVGKVLTIDQFECISCGTCVEQTDKVYYLPDDGKATPIAQDGPMDLIQDAIDACPVTCIAWTPPAEAEERGLATGMDGGE